MTRRAVLALIVVLGAATPACWVDSRSSGFACTTDADCAQFVEGRTCDTSIGYCVPEVCPAACDSCDVSARTCAINCGSGSSSCGSVRCPEGYDCTITCAGAGACTAIECAGARSCTITCSGGNPNNEGCSDIECGDGPCDVTCTTENACERVDCNDSCQCDVACALGTTCDAATCSTGCSAGSLGCTSSLPGCSVCP